MQMTFTGERYVPQLRGQIYYEHLHRYALAMSLARDKDVLDIASGEGYGSALLAMVARSVVGVDVDDASVRFSGSRYTSMNLSFRAGSATQIPVADASVDLIVSFETIEHLTEHERMLGEFRRVLRPGGHAIISSPNKLVYSDARGYTNPFHLRELYFHEFRDMLRDFFPEIRLFGHRIFAGSAVYALNGTSEQTKWLSPSSGPEAGMSQLADPEYFIAICGTLEGESIPDLGSVYLDPRDDLLDDVRSGGLAADAMQPMLAGADAGKRANGAKQLALSEGRTRPAALSAQNVEEDLRARIFELEELRSNEFDRATALESMLQSASERSALLEENVAQARADADELRDASKTLVEVEERHKAELRKVQRRDAELRLTVDSLREELLEVHNACVERDVESHSLRAKIAEAHAFIDESSARSGDLRADYERRLSEETDLAARLDEANARRIQAEDELLQIQRTANELLASNSWKLTRPIRQLAAVFSNRD
jgi:ubiquinone/menaquinone biosynthesis C-methylase UbiE